MTVIEWYAGLSATFGTPAAIVFGTYYLRKDKEDWITSAALVLACILWLVGCGVIISFT